MDKTVQHLQPYPELEGKIIHPAGFRLLVRPLTPQTGIKTSSGIVLHKPEQTIDREKGGMDLGEVLEVGTACWKRPDHGSEPWCKVGDYIRFYAYKGAPVEHPTHGTVFIVNDSDVLGVYQDEVAHG
jgi:co-chaperonin GroES (HSP10)